jgi:hypothetical protein
MAVANIDTVYQRVLALANKEQRGYITPQEFNLLAGKAQNDIFEMYFHDYKTALLSPSGSAKVADDISILEQKIDVHRLKGVSTATNNTLASDVHYLESLYHDHNTKGRVIIEEVNAREFHQIKSNPKLTPSESRPVFYRSSSNQTGITVIPTTNLATVKHDYIKRPADPKWGYVVVSDKALYNPAATHTVPLSLHASEESTLTNKILELAGIVINKPGLSEVILRNEAVKEANENK